MIAILNGIEAEPGPLPDSKLAPDANGWRREPVWRYEGGCSTGDYTLGWEYQALYVNDLFGVAVEIVAHVTHDPHVGHDPMECWAMERMGTGTIIDGEVEINDYEYDHIDCWVQSTPTGWDDVVRTHVMADIRSALIAIPLINRRAEIAEAVKVKRQLHESLRRFMK